MENGNEIMKGFRQDYIKQIELTVKQLKSIVNNKNVYGKGDKLAQTVYQVLVERLDESIKRAEEKAAENVVENEENASGEVTEQVISEAVGSDEMLEKTAESEENKSVDAVEKTVESEETESTEAADTARDFIQMAVHSLISYGNMECINEIFEKYIIEDKKASCPQVEDLIDACSAYAQAVMLSRPEDIIQSYGKLSDITENIISDFTNEPDTLPDEYRELVCNIHEKLEFMDKKAATDVPQIALWCLNNGMVEQAAHIYAELMPKYLFENKVIYYNDFSTVKKNDGAYPDTVIDARKKARSAESIEYFWLNDMLWKNVSRKLFFNIDSPIDANDSETVAVFKKCILEIKNLQSEAANKVTTDMLSYDLTNLLEMVAQGTYISPVLNTLKKVCNYFFNYEVAGVAGSVQKNYRELGKLLIMNRRFVEAYFGTEGERFMSYTPASALMDSHRGDVQSEYDPWVVENILRDYDVIRQQSKVMNRQQLAGIHQMSYEDLEKCIRCGADRVCGLNIAK